MRAPSSLYSTLTSWPSSASAASRFSAGLASIGRTGRPTSGATAPSAAAPPARASRAVSGRRPDRKNARRTVVGGHVRRCGDRFQHHALQRALAQLAGEQPLQEPLLVRRRGTEQRLELRGAAGRRAGARRGRQRVEPGLDVRDPRPGRGAGRHLQAGERAPARTEPALPRARR
jgi:hypothetical protein